MDREGALQGWGCGGVVGDLSVGGVGEEAAARAGRKGAQRRWAGGMATCAWAGG